MQGKQNKNKNGVDIEKSKDIQENIWVETYNPEFQSFSWSTEKSQYQICIP